MKKYENGTDFDVLVREYAYENEMVVFYKGVTDAVENLLRRLNKEGIEPCTIDIENYTENFDCIKDVDLPGVVLGDKYILSCAEINDLLSAQQNDKELFYKGVDYAALNKALQDMRKAFEMGHIRYLSMLPLETTEQMEIANLLYLPDDQQIKITKVDLPY